MCGIFGALDFRKGRQVPRETLSRMAGVIHHRGPDDGGEYFDGPAALGMRRLSIIDLSGGHQPILNETGRIAVVCNGEIYNFQDIRAGLEQHGHAFKTNSDTEVIVHGYEQYGLDFVKRLRGMFGLAIWDGDAQRLVVARDRLGKKPIYIYRDPNRLMFASELKSMLHVEGVSRELEPAAIAQYLELGYIPAPYTPFRGITKLLPGHLLVVEKGEIRDLEYWDVSFDQTEQRSEQEWIELVRAKFLESVRMRLISDVPLGAFLSGGIDSSSIVGAMAQFSDQPVKTYSIGFGEQDKYYDELPFAKSVAEKFRTDHHEIIVRPDVTELLPRLMWHLDEPIADSAFITTYLVSRLARESVTVILSGVGGDELFGGYRRYLGDRLLKYYRLVPAPLRRTLPALVSKLPHGRHSALENNIRYASAFMRSAEQSAQDRYMSYIRVFSPELQNALLAGRETADGDMLRAYFARAEKADPSHQLLYFDMKTSLPDDLLALTDKMTMAASIECRAPFMDHELVELTARIPWDTKVRGVTLKHLLKKVVAPFVPPAILERKKRGFGAPVGAWFKRDLSGMVRDMLSPSQISKRGFFQPEAVESIISEHEANRADHTDGLLALVSLEVWCQLFLDGGERQFSEPMVTAVRAQ